MRALVITGTDTGVGKTIVSAAIAALARDVAYIKPAQTGDDSDIDVVRALSGITDVHELARFPDPLNPATAAARAGRDGVTPEHVAHYVRALDRDLVLIEGAGGLLVRFDAQGGTIADVAALLDAPVLVVVRAGLGTLNHTALTCEALSARGVACAGIVIGSWPADPDLAARCNLDDLAAIAPIVGRLPEGAGRMNREDFLATARQNLEVEIPA